MNVNNNRQIVKVILTKAIKNGEVLESKSVTGRPTIFYTNTLLDKDLFRQGISGLVSTKKINQLGPDNLHIPFSDTYTAKRGNKVLSIIFNYKNRTTTYIKKILNRKGQTLKKSVFTRFEITPRDKISNKNFNVFDHLGAGIDGSYYSAFNNGKLQNSRFNFINENGTVSSTLLVKNSKPTKTLDAQKALYTWHKHVEERNELLEQMLNNGSPEPLTIVQRPLKNGKVVWAATQKGTEPVVETLDLTRKEFQQGMPDLTETREIYINYKPNAPKKKAYDIYTINNKQFRVKLIKNYLDQQIKMIVKPLSKNGNAGVETRVFVPEKALDRSQDFSDFYSEVCSLYERTKTK